MSKLQANWVQISGNIILLLKLVNQNQGIFFGLHTFQLETRATPGISASIIYNRIISIRFQGFSHSNLRCLATGWKPAFWHKITISGPAPLLLKVELWFFFHAHSWDLKILRRCQRIFSISYCFQMAALGSVHSNGDSFRNRFATVAARANEILYVDVAIRVLHFINRNPWPIPKTVVARP